MDEWSAQIWVDSDCIREVSFCLGKNHRTVLPKRFFPGHDVNVNFRVKSSSKANQLMWLGIWRTLTDRAWCPKKSWTLKTMHSTKIHKRSCVFREILMEKRIPGKIRASFRKNESSSVFFAHRFCHGGTLETLKKTWWISWQLNPRKSEIGPLKYSAVSQS